MAEILDPRLEHGGPPGLTMEQFIRENALALEDLKTLSMRTRLAANQSTGSGASTSGSQQGSSPVATPQPQPLSHPQTQPKLQTGNGTSPAPTTASPRPPMNATIPHGVGRPPIRPATLPHPPEGLMPLPDVRAILGVGNQQQRDAIFEKVNFIQPVPPICRKLTPIRHLGLKRDSSPLSPTGRLTKLKIIKIVKLPLAEWVLPVQMVRIRIRTFVLQIQHWHQPHQVHLLPLPRPRTPPRRIPNPRPRRRRRRRRRRRARLNLKTKISLKSIQSDHLDLNQHQLVRLLLRTKEPTHMDLLPHPTPILQVVLGVYQADHST